MMEYGFCHSSPKPNYGKVAKKCSANISPARLTFTANFTKTNRKFKISSPLKKASMRQDILEAVMKRTESLRREIEDDNPKYEDPKDVIGEKPPKPPRKRDIQALGMLSPGSNKDGKTLLKEQKKKMTKKYGGLITALMDKCEENVLLISEKETHITKLKEKLKAVLEYNQLFAEENDQLKMDHGKLVKHIEECKIVIKEERERYRELEAKSKDLEERVMRFEVPDRDHHTPTTAIPLVEVCMNCSSRMIILNQAKEQNSRLQKDMQALKDVLYRLNVQLSRYQERLRSNVQMSSDGKDHVFQSSDKYGGLDSLIAASLGCKGTDYDGHTVKSEMEDQSHTNRVVDLSGLLSAQALAPLFDAYQENLQEKDTLIQDYEKQFESINKKSKQIIEENKCLSEKVNLLDEELAQVRQSYKKTAVEKETTDIEKVTLLERAERAESKLKEVYEMYEDKMAAMMRDYETVHREYFTVKSALEASAGKMAQFDALRARTVPADLHERRLDHCKRLLEELKHQYGMENERKSEQIKKLEEQVKCSEENYNSTCKENEVLKEELKTALKNVRLYRKAAVIFRQRVKSATARISRVRRSARLNKSAVEPLKHALDNLERIKSEIKVVKTRAHTSLEELERRILEQERRAAQAQASYRRELDRASVALEHKEGIIRSLIDKVADVEEVRLSQANMHRLQGIIISDSSPEGSPKAPEGKSSVKLVPGSGGYFQDQSGKKKKG